MSSDSFFSRTLLPRHVTPRQLIALLLGLASTSPAAAEFIVTLDPAAARFTYFPSGHGPGIPGGVPGPYELHFGMQGTLTIEEQSDDVARITDASFVLLGNESAFQRDPDRRAELEQLSRQILLEPFFTIEHGPPRDRLVLTADVDGPDLVLEFFRQQLVAMRGGPDQRPVDGNGYEYLYPVPEPQTFASALAALSCVLLSFVLRRRRPNLRAA